MLGPGDRVEQLGEDDVLAPVALHLDHELDPGPVVKARVDGAGELEPRALRDVEREAQPPRRAGGEAPADDVVQAEPALARLEHGLAALARGRGLDEAVAGAEQVHRFGGTATAGEQEGGRDRQGGNRSHRANRPR